MAVICIDFLFNNGKEQTVEIPASSDNQIDLITGVKDLGKILRAAENFHVTPDSEFMVAPHYSFNMKEVSRFKIYVIGHINQEI